MWLHWAIYILNIYIYKYPIQSYLTSPSDALAKASWFHHCLQKERITIKKSFAREKVRR